MTLESLRDRMDLAALRDSTDERYLAGLALVFAFALWIRLIPRNAMEHLQALDPYMIARMSQSVVENGHMPLVDAWRYFPFVTPTWQLNLGDIYIPAYLYKIVEPFGVDFITWAQVYPALAGAAMVAAMYFIGKELWGRDTGILAAFFLAASPAVLQRSSAGWFEKEPIAAFLMFVSIYFVVRAWRRESWTSGILAGTAFGIAFTAWGGIRFLTLFYPLVAFSVAFIDEDVERLMAAFTPTLIIGHLLVAILNPARWSVPNDTFVLGMGVLGLIWARYAVEALDLVPEDRLSMVTPSLTVVGGILAFLSPLYSQTLAGYVQSAMAKALQSSSAVVASTVAENQPASAGQIIGSLGALNAGSVIPLAGTGITEFFSGWTFALIGTSLLLLVLVGMLAKKYLGIDTVSSRTAYAAFFGTFIIFISVALFLVPGSGLTAFVFAFVVVLAGVAVLMVAPPDGMREVPLRWELIIPLLWILSTLYGASQRSRLLFLTAHPVALMAGYGLAAGIHEVRRSELWDIASEKVSAVDPALTFKALVALFLIPVIIFNGAAAFGMAQSVGGSPNQLWMENLEFMREETPVDSVVLSWWDYGYWFETIGGRAAIADGGNLQFYSDATDYKIINWPLADFLTSEDPAAHMDWLDDLSVDYVVLDSTMIGKYSAVSTIHNRGNSTTSLITAECETRNGRCATTRASDNRTYIPYRDSQTGTEFLAPVAQRGDGVGFDGTPLLRTQEGTAPVANVCTSRGVVPTASGNESALPGCVAFHPYRQHQTLVYVPEEAMRSTLVRLYIMDAHEMPAFEEVFDNGFVKMWKVDTSGSAG